MMSTPIIAPSGDQSKPYKGAESYQTEDEALFFGREQDADRLIAKILSSRFTLVHAQSGAGKTSLLNARIIPGLETRGWGAFRILPQDDPIESVRAATLKYLLPHPEAERQALQRAWDLLIPPHGVPSLDDVISGYEKLEIRDSRRRELIAPVKMSSTHDSDVNHESALVNPFFCRLLRSGIEVEAFAEHLGAIAPIPPISRWTPVDHILELLSERTFLSAYVQLHNEVNVPGRNLHIFFKHLFMVFGRQRNRPSLVLLLDQFEELFTRYTDPGQVAPDLAKNRPDWRLRYEFFKELQGLYSPPIPPPVAGQGEENSVEASVLPIRFVISMRDEYIAQLGEMRVEDNSYHLNLLETKQATEAIEEPAALFGYTYEEACFDLIIKQLTKEERFVEPAHLQLVCEKLWNEQGKDLARLSGENENHALPPIKLETFKSLGEIGGILRAFLNDFLVGLDDAELVEVIELLEPLVTASGTRNIIEREQLVNAPFRDSVRRRILLDKLVNHTIVRTEPRLGGYFVEITHEFLIGAILEAIRESWTRDPEYSRYRLALRTLERLQDDSIAESKRLLSQQEFNTLHQHRTAIRWTAWSAELMLRSAVAQGVVKDTLLVWLNMFRDHASDPSLAALFPEAKKIARESQRNLLSLAELRRVNENRGIAVDLSKEQLELIWRSQLTWAADDERADVEYWTERMIADG